MLDSTDDEDSVRPEAVGIVVEVNANLHSAVIHTEGYGRVLMPTQLAGEDDFVLGDWCSVKVERNDENYSSEVDCSFIVCERPKKVAEVYSTSVSISKDFLEGVIVCAPIFVGNITATGAVAVNPQFGRIFIDPLRVINGDLRPLMWIEAHLRYCLPNESSFFCRWLAHNLKPITEDQQTAKVYRYSVTSFLLNFVFHVTSRI
ncbi:hypothetical protein AB6A40_010868 [Gnathostoma spinigerum]|uniref:Uncharacterized protein n=1 Tax=Gnathostoma spinigerum TaxID=75299 RepID=A0ABD6F0P1_9BILA